MTRWRSNSRGLRATGGWERWQVCAVSRPVTLRTRNSWVQCGIWTKVGSHADPDALGLGTSCLHTRAVRMSEPRTIKKYPNRRLYDTVESRYITLADIRRLVIDRIDFVVMDKKSQEDITRSILLQLLPTRVGRQRRHRLPRNLPQRTNTNRHSNVDAFSRPGRLRGAF